MSDSEDTAQLLGSKPSEVDNTSILNANNVKPFSNTFNLNKNNQFIPNVRNHIYEAPTYVQTFMGTLASTLAWLVFGFDMTIGNNLLLSLGTILDLNCFEHRMLINSWIIGAILASFFGGFIIDKCGRRSSILGSSIILTFSSLLGFTSGAYLIPFVPRFISGCSACTLVLSQCVYSVETSPSDSRFTSAVLHQLCLQLGILLSAVVGFENSTNSESHFFHIVTGMICIFAIIIFFVTYIFLPESPHYIVSVEKRTNLGEQHLGKNERSFLYSIIWPVVSVVILVFLMKLCGRSWVLYYSPRLFSLTGICTSIADSITALTTSSIRLLSVNILFFTMGRLGIRASILTSLSLMTVSTAILSAISAVDESHSPHLLTPGPRVCNVLPIYSSIGMLPLAEDTEFKFSDFKAVITGDGTPPPFPLLPTPVALYENKFDSDNNPSKCPDEELLTGSEVHLSFRMAGVITLLTYEAGYTLGFGSLGWLLVCEIFPTKWRARGLGISVGIYFIIDLITQMIFLKISIPLCGMFMIFSVVSGFTFAVCYVMLPDTKYKTLTEIQSSMIDRYAVWWVRLRQCFGSEENVPASQSAHI